MLVQQTGHSSEESVPTSQTPQDSNKGTQRKDRNEKKETKKTDLPPPNRILPESPIPADDRLTIFFHAVLSKDFKMDLKEDRVFLRADRPIGSWEKNLIELFPTRDLGDHGFLVEGKLITTKTLAATVSIPYKYIFYKAKDKEYHYEYIYKLDTEDITNRCLFVKSHLLSKEGDWHQYDDIICAPPSKSFLNQLKSIIWPEHRKSLIEGRDLAGKIMLGTIFELLRSWSDINLNNFFCQLKQFQQIYENPFVYEGMHKKWMTLEYGEKEVSGQQLCFCWKCTDRNLFQQAKAEQKLFENFQIDWRFGKLVSTIIHKSWPRDSSGHYLDGDEVVLQHLLNWNAAKNIFQLHGSDEKVISQLSEDAAQRIAIASSAFASVSDQFLSGHIPIKLLNHILKKKDIFVELLKIDCLSNSQHCKDSSAMGRLLRWRQEEVKDIYHEKHLVETLLVMCRTLQEHIKGVYFHMQEDIETMTLDQFMKVHLLDETVSLETGMVTFFNIDKDVRQMAEVLHTVKDSYIFKMCWEGQARQKSKTHDDEEEEEEEEEVEDEDDSDESEVIHTLDVIHERIFTPCYKRYEWIYVNLKNGSLKLQDVDNIFEAYKDKYEELRAHLEIMCQMDRSDDKRWIERRIQQIEQYHELHLAVDSAKVIMNVKDTLCLQGNFKVLHTLLEVTHVNFKQESLDRIDSDLMQAKKVLVDITESRRQCLEELHIRRNFVVWVKEALEDINELKVFVDLASISAGENDLDVDRVACFHDAVLGYSSMLYDLKPEADFHTLENDFNLPKKLRDTARHLEWLKTVKDSHGSVELSSLSLASAINKNGIYIISAQNLSKVLKLKIPEEHEEGQEMRCYSLEDLRELQNKLMLMSGKGEQGQCEVERFAEVFTNVQRLAKAFLDLFAAGNPLFRCWEANINCSPHSEAGIIMDFSLDGIVKDVMVEGNMVDQLPELCRKMEKCLSFWNNFMDKQRSLYYYLNYYTAEQIVYLCNNLTQKSMNEGLEDQVLMMLSFIKPNCSILHLRQQACGSRKLDLVWNAYMNDMKHFLPDFLDIRSLGMLLEILAQNEDEDFLENPVFRTLPKGLMNGRPNLIICPNAEILLSCISIYMNTEHVQLPTYDEVLLCTASTPLEQAELFLRRCLTHGGQGEKIYTMLYADQLPYEVSYKVEQFFQRLETQCCKDYRLVIICNSEREHAYLPSAFSQFRLHMIPLEPLDRIQRYLCRHYTVPLEQSSAAAVFKESLCVGIVSSVRAGVGKSLYIQRLYEKLKKETSKETMHKCIRLIEPRVDENFIMKSLLSSNSQMALTVFHFDVTSSVQKGLHEFLFKLLVLRYLMNSEGKMWKCSNHHLYVVEILESTGNLPKSASRPNPNAHYAFLDVFPKIFCHSPKEVLEIEMRMQDDTAMGESDNPLMDDQEFRSEAFQRPYQYLKRFYNGECLDNFFYNGVEGTHVECLQMFFVYCGIVDPSWAELRNFAYFLNVQLRHCETSVFCDVNLIGDTLQGFKNFVVDFMILMAKDFATPSLSISDQSPGRQQVDLAGVNEEDLAPFLIRKRWEREPHPYIFFNDDQESMTFIGFHLEVNERNLVDAIDPEKGTVIKKNIMTRELYEGLRLQRVPFNINFDDLPRGEKIERLCNVLGIQWPLDPDETYELTTDNILKMLAIHMRFRCGIPVIIMGETGCGKTRLIKFLCELRRSGVETENMKLVKVHGGTSSEMIYCKVREAQAIAVLNKQNYNFDSVLFFDEANTTEAISSIKEIVCDNTVEGESLEPGTGLQIIAACNPYRKHTDQMISRLESAGLGYRVRVEDTEDKLGSIPLRQLVYRVQALPPSMIPLVWDFGQLNDGTEKMYIHQIVQRVVEANSIKKEYIKIITDVLSSSQKYMRTRRDECSFVSLRDVERCMQTFVWFYKNHSMFLDELQKFLKEDQRLSADRNPVLWSLVMATGVCYHACLEDKQKYRVKICRHLPGSYSSHQNVLQEISRMQDLFLSGVPLGKTIAKNNALKENVFMMVICIELRIPLFLVGKPGSSKSLSKTLVADAMQGQAAHSELYKKLKQIHLVSFQCSPHSTPEGIINTFKQCARFQEGKNLMEYISVVVLDEIGLAEDSPKMPLKTLHPLLEEGCIDDEPLPHKKVGFIGISNWALDPAKMNRGIFVSRGDPDEKELINSAKGICSSDKMIQQKVRDLFRPFARAYLSISKRQGKGFFGLRDYYSSIKMMFAVTRTSKQKPTPKQIMEVVLRNFSGRDDIDAVQVFAEWLNFSSTLENVNKIDLVRQNISSIGQEDCRYLLVLTKNYAALQILQQTFFSERCQPEIIFGSSFPKDQEYTQICRNINRVKICMETGQTIVLLNLQNLYESLYDALNQYYVSLGGQNYVDLGLGTHRVKCRVHKDFRLIVIEEKEVVYKQFPIPLINRLEKHYLDINTVLRSNQKEIVKELEKWVRLFVSLNSQNLLYKYAPADVFIGYHSDTCASVVLQVTESLKEQSEFDTQKRILEKAKLILLNCATPDSVVRLDCTTLPRVETEELTRMYFEEQRHSSLVDFIHSHRWLEESSCTSFTEVTTFSRLLTASDVEQLQKIVGNVELLSLQQFDTEHSFLKKIRNFLDSGHGDKILIIQTEFDEGSLSTNLIGSAKYSAMNEINKSREKERREGVFVYFITKLPRIGGGTSYVGFHGGPWRSAHIDDLRKSTDIVSDIKALSGLTISQLFEEMSDKPECQLEAEQTETMEDIYREAEQTETMQDMGLEQTETPQEMGLEAVLDTTTLVRSSVQSAVGMLRDQVDDGTRSTRRVEILLTLLCDNDNLKATFLKITKKRLHSLLRMHDENTFLLKNWVFKEASNFDALQEGGTFRHTLWKRVQAVLIPFLAQLISVIDRDCNLDLLLDMNSGEAVKRLWLDIFTNEKLLIIPYTNVDSRYVHVETKTILVQRHVMSDKNMGCNMPFSWRIKDYLDELWVYALQREGNGKFFTKTPLGRYIVDKDKEMQREFFQRYLQDYISMTMKVTSEEQLQLLCRALACCVNELRGRLEVDGDKAPTLPWVHAAYEEFKNRLQNFSRMLTIEPQMTQALLRNQHITVGDELILDVYAALASVEYLEPLELNTDRQRLDWLRRVKRLQVPIELVCSEENLARCGERSQEMTRLVRSCWNRIFSLSLFVEHMLLGIEQLETKLQPVVLEHTQRLGQVLQQNSDLKAKVTFEKVIEVLKACKDGATFSSPSRFGFRPCPVCLGDPQDPLSLPCEHIYCLKCIKQWFLVPGQMMCPVCKQEVPGDFALTVSEDVRVLINLNAQFRKQCNAFFIDLVSTVCFKENTPPSHDIILHLLSFLTVEGTHPGRDAKRRLLLTKALSPFDDAADKNPVVRSVVLKLLLKYSFENVKDYLQRHLAGIEQSNILEEKDKTELYCLYINCLEDSMFERIQRQTTTEQQVHLQDERGFLCHFIECSSPATATIEYLQQIARVRLSLDLSPVKSAAPPPNAEDQTVVAPFLESVEDLCGKSGNDWYRIYLIRKVCSQHGVDFIHKLLKMPDLKWLFPEELHLGQMDQYLVHGEQYKDVREAVAKAVIETKMEGIDEACEKCKCSPGKRILYLLLALFREVTCLYKAANPTLHPKPQVMAHSLGEHVIVVIVTIIAFISNSNAPDGGHAVTELTIHLAAVLYCGINGVLVPLRMLAQEPAKMQGAFIPTMPEDMLVVAQQVMGQLQWYSCPNGHYCTIGECGRPMEVGRCLDCGAEIGGINHNPVANFRVANIQGDRTQTGHILGDPRRRDNPDMLDTKSMSLGPFTIVRLLTHMAMLLGANGRQQDIINIIKPQVQDPRTFLMGHLLKDVEHLTRTLGNGVDGTISAVHLTLRRLMEPYQPSQWPVPYDDTLSSKEARNGWEMAVATDIITPQLKHLEHELKEVNTLIRTDSRISANPIMKVIFGDPRIFLASLPKDSLIHGPAVWSCRERVSLVSLAHIVEQNNGKETVPLLWRFLQKEAELRLVKFLPDILALQMDLVKKFQNVTDLTYLTIDDFVRNQKSGNRIRVFLTTWNQLRLSLATNGELKIPAEFCREDLDFHSDLRVLLPQRQGKGLCSTALVSYLIALHNDLIYAVNKHTGEETSYTVSPVDLTDLHVIRYELERDLIPLVLSNCQYSMERGQEILMEYDLPKIQQKILTRFLQGKPLITLSGIPTLVNRHDRNYENILKDIKRKVGWEPLTSLVLTALAGELPSYSDVCDALTVVEVALGFLAMTGGEPHMQLVRYLQDVLQMGDQTPPHILKALSRCSLKHCIALWQFLTSLKSETMLHLKRDPFSGIPEDFKKPLSGTDQQLLKDFLTKGSVDVWLLESHEFLLLALKTPRSAETYKPTWTLKHTLVSYMERKECDVPADLEEFFPDEICLSHFVEAWKLAVAFKQERILK
uniref:RING-type E3 ubiquitin transferase n=1 Tax=Scleropages formosus TaxID=113540 RepID=A0A8C9SEG1_SCLFO